MQAYGGRDLLQEIFGNTVKVFPAGMCWGKVGMWGTKKIENIGDLKGKRIRTTNPFLGKIYSEAGASLVTIVNPPDVIFELSGGSLDATEAANPLWDMMVGFHKYTQYCYFPSLQMTAGAYCVYVNKEKWEGLLPDLKEIVTEACNAANAKSLTNWLLEDAKAIKLLQDQGKVTITKFSKEMQQEILDKFVAQYDAVPDATFQKVWKSQKDFMKIYVPYMELQKVDAVVKLK
jgi:TRAP-type mannitol/chloroaromatic compound transport system substrate-binding protein